MLNTSNIPMEDIIFYGIITFILLENLFEIYIGNRQIKVYRESKDIPKQLQDSITEETFNKARLYGLDKQIYEVYKTILVDIIIVTIELFVGFVPFMWNMAEIYANKLNLDPTNEIHVSCIFVLLMNSISLFKSLPFKIYKTFVLEERHGFNKQTWQFFVKDEIKAFLIGQIIFIPITSAIVYIVGRGGNYFFIWLWAFTGVTVFLFSTIYPILIAPLFDKYRPLDEGELRESIEKLAASISFPLKNLFIVEGSKRSAHSNAYLYGLWGSKRIVLFDTLLINKGKKDDSELQEDEKNKGCSNEEVLAVLAHELGHWKIGHVVKNIIIMQIYIFVMFFAFQLLFKYDTFYIAFGFAPGKRPILVGLLVILSYVLAVYNIIMSFIMTIISRKFEYQADEFACKLGYGTELGQALIKLHIDNLGFPFYDWLYSAWNHSHPTLIQRLEKIEEITSKTE